MSILETVAVFVGIPAAVFAVIAAAVYLSGVRPSRRYRPGRPYEFTPVWFVSAEGRIADTDRPAADAVKGGARGSW